MKTNLIKFALFLFISTFALAGCTIEGISYYDTVPFGYAYPASNPDKRDISKVVVLLHGMDAPRDGHIKELEVKLAQDIEDATIINLNRWNSRTDDMNTQVEQTFSILKRILEQHGLSRTRMVVLGDSQGGVLAAALRERYGERLNIVGVVTNHAPLEGANVNPSPADVQALEQAIGPRLLALNGISLANIVTKELSGPGALDLLPTSNFIRSIQGILANPNATMLTLGGYIDPIEGCVQLFKGFTGYDLGTPISLASWAAPGYFNGIRNQLNRIVGTPNDCLVALPSQTAQHVGHSDIARPVIQGYHHFHSIVACQTAYSQILGFINSCFDAHQ